jgi:hypothetical protein
MKHILFTLFIVACLTRSDAQQIPDSSGTLSHDSVNKAVSAPYATLYVYRPRNFVGSLESYNLHEADSIICRVKNNSKYIIRLYQEGPAEIWAKTEKKVSVKINVVFGKEYFLKCGLKGGIMTGRPEMELVYPEQGKLDFENVEGREKDNGNNNASSN